MIVLCIWWDHRVGLCVSEACVLVMLLTIESNALPQTHSVWHMSHVTCDLSCGTCHFSHVMCHMSHVIYDIFFILLFSPKVVKLVGGGSVVNGTYPA